MTKRLRAALVVSFALAIAGSVLVIPAGGAEVDVLRLQLNSNGDRFILDGQTQTLSQANCKLRSTGASLVSVVGGNDGNTRNPYAGLKDHRIGVGQNGEGSGEPCARINRDLGQFLRLGLTGALAGRTIDYAEIDLGFKFNGDAQLVLLLGGTEVGTVVVPCSGVSDCGPDSGASDNERVVLYQESEFPGGFPSGHWQSFPITSDFDTIIIRPGSASASGSVSLEAGFDGSPAGPLGVDLGTVDTLFRLSNTAPMANADPDQESYTTTEDTPLVVAAPGVLANDSDVDGDTLEAVVEVGPSNGALTLNSNGGFTYTPDLNFNGPDSFTYRATDGTASSAPATVSITVTPVNDAPVATATSVAVDEDNSVIVPVGTDVDGDALTVSCSGASNGTVTDNRDGSITYTPTADSNAGDTLSCTASDGNLSSDAANVDVTVSPVNDDPVANDDSAETNANVAVAINVVSNDTDIDGDTLNVASTTDGASGTVTDNGDGTVEYAPNLDFFGTDSFTYTVSDGNGGSDTADVSVTVFEVMCSGDEVSDVDGDVSGTFTRLTDSADCKRYVIDADAESGTVLFQPEGDVEVSYRGYLEFGGETPPGSDDTTGFPLFLEYDPDPEGEDIFQPLPWCTHNVFDAEGNVESATIPDGDSWCIASAFTRGEGTVLVTTWQVFGRDDPIIKAR